MFADANNVAQHIDGVNAHQHGAGAVQITFDKCEMFGWLNRGLVNVQIEGPGRRRLDAGPRHVLDDAVVAEAVGN